MESGTLFSITNPILSMEVYVHPSTNKSQDMWVKRNLRFDGTLLVCLEDKKVHPSSFMEMSPTTNSFSDDFQPIIQMDVEEIPRNAVKEDTSSPPGIKHTKHLRTCLVATPENWFGYMTSSKSKTNKGKSNTCIKYFKLPQWTIHISEMAGIYVPTNTMHPVTANSTLPYTFVVKTKSGEEYVVKTQSLSEWSAWTFVLQMAHSSYMRQRNTPPKPYFASPGSIGNKSGTTLAPSDQPPSSDSEISLPSPKFTSFHAEDIAQACFFDSSSPAKTLSLAERRGMKATSLDMPFITGPLPMKVPASVSLSSKSEVCNPPIRLLSPETLN